MKNNTFDIPAYKFALVKFDEDISKDKYTTDFMINNPDKIHIIPFENVDGLTAKDIKLLFHQEHNYFLFICYISFDYKNKFGIEYRFQNFILPILLDIPDEIRIDTFIRDHMQKWYNNTTEDFQKIFGCFLERYCYQDQTEVLKRIKESN